MTGFGAETGGAAGRRIPWSPIAFTGGDSAGRQDLRERRRGSSSGSRWNWAASRRTSCSRMPSIDDAVKGAVSGIFAASGQTCMAGSRLLVHTRIHDAFVERLVDS